MGPNHRNRSFAGRVMNRLRAGLVALVVAFLSTVGLVATSGPAQAAAVDVDPRILTVVDTVTWSPSEVITKRISDLALRGTVGMTQAQIIEATPILNSLGTASEVRVGTKLASRACRTGWGCLGVFALGVGLGAHATSDTWLPWLQGLTDPAAPYPVPQFYARTGGTVGCTDTRIPAGSESSYYGPTVAPWYVRCTSTGTVQTGAKWGVDAVHRTTGEWLHWEGTHNQLVGTWDGAGMTHDYPLNVWGSRTSAEWELRKIHLIGDQINDGGSQHLDKGFYWGYETAPGDGSIESLTRCKRPDNSVYDVVLSEPVATGLAAVPACEQGDTPVYVEQTHVAPDGTRSIQSSTRLDDPSGLGNQMYPLCAGAGCQWFVKVNGVQCTKGSAACVSWTEEKQDASCWYGPYEMPLAECYFLERAYQFGPSVPATKWNTDGDPLTWDGPTPQLQPTSSPTASPSTTTSTTTTTSPSPTTSVSPAPTGDPSPSPSTTTTTTTDPSPSSSPSASGSPSPAPSSVPGSAGAPSPSDADGVACWPSGWAMFNPAEWVLQPIKCAFTPDPALTQARVDSLRTQLGQHGPGPLITAVGDVVDSVPAGGGCQGPAVPFNLSGVSETIHPFSACTEPMSTVAGYAKALATVLVVVSGGFSIVRGIGSGFGWSFGVRGGGGSGD